MQANQPQKTNRWLPKYEWIVLFGLETIQALRAW